MRRPSFNRPMVAAFEAVFRPWMYRRLAGVHVSAELQNPLDPRRPIVLVANHVSWWDGFLLREVQRRLRPKAPLYTLMSSEELDRFPFFRWLGVEGVDPSPIQLVVLGKRLEREAALDPSLVLSFFPQGRIWPSHRRPLGFAPGLRFFLERMPHAQIVPVALHLEPLNRPAPTAFAHCGEAMPAQTPVAEIERVVTRELDRLLAWLAEHGEQAPRRWPAGLDPSLAQVVDLSGPRGGTA